MVMTPVAERRHHRLGARHVVVLDRAEGQQQPGGRLSGQHARPLRQSARGVSRRAAAPHARPRLQRRHRHHRRRHRCDAGRQRRAHRESQRRARHRGAVLRRARDQRRVGPARRRRAQLHAEGRPAACARTTRDLAAEFVAAGYTPHRHAHRAEGAARAADSRPRACWACSPAAHVGRLRQGRRGQLQLRAVARQEHSARATSRCSTR